MATSAPDGLTAAEFAELQRLKPADAMRWMAQRTKGAVTYSWQDLWQSEHGHQFTISRLAKVDLLASIQESLSRSVAGDLSRKDWMRDTEQLLRDAGWWGEQQVVDPTTGKLVTTRFDPARLKLIYDTNTRQAAAAGQWERIQRTKKTHPYLRYITKRDDRVRPLHASWDNVTLPVDDAFWQTHYPPNGWRCRCRVVAVNQRDYDAGKAPGGAPMKKEAPEVVTTEFVNRRTGEVTQVPVGVDPGFDYHVGAARRRDLDALVTAKMRGLPPELAREAQFQGLTLEAAAATYAEIARLKPAVKQPALPLAPISDAALRQALAMDVELQAKWVGLDHDSTMQVFRSGGRAGDGLAGQVEITAADLALFPEIFNRAKLKRGNPANAADGAALLAGEAEVGDFRYRFVAKVRSSLVVVYKLWKWLLK